MIEIKGGKLAEFKVNSTVCGFVHKIHGSKKEIKYSFKNIIVLSGNITVR